MARSMLLALALAPALSLTGHVTIPVAKHVGNDPADAASMHSIARFKAAAAGTKPPFTIEPATFAKHDFWYGLFDVGNAKNLRLVLDSGSPFVVVNPGLYKPSSVGREKKHNGNITYSGIEPDGCGALTVYFDLYADTVKAALSGLTVKNQTIFKSLKHKHPGPNVETHLQPPFQGIVGFDGDNINLKGGAYFGNACKQGQVDECRFGMAFGTSGTGKAILGGVDSSLFTGQLETTHEIKGRFNEWRIPGAAALNGSVVLKNLSYALDTGTPNVLGYITNVQQLFKESGIQAVEQQIPSCGTVLFGYYPCDKPPTIGFTVGGKVWEIEPSAFPLKNNGKNNCTATIVGVEGQGVAGVNGWVLGQSWMQGKYIDFDVTGNTISAAALKDPVKAT